MEINDENASEFGEVVYDYTCIWPLRDRGFQVLLPSN